MTVKIEGRGFAKGADMLTILELSDASRAAQKTKVTVLTADELRELVAAIDKLEPEDFIVEGEGPPFMAVTNDQVVIGSLILNEKTGEIAFEPVMHTREFTKSVLGLLLVR